MWHVMVVLLSGLLIYGEKLPGVVLDGLKILRSLRRMATTATADLSRELGTEISVEDLNPKNFVRKHLLSEEDEAALRKPLQGLYDDIKADVSGIGSDVKSTAASLGHGAESPAAAQTPVAEPAPSRYIDVT
jgi:sec-independent protein translocase protein TatB